MKNIILILDNFDQQNPCLNEFLTSKIKQGNSSILMHSSDDVYQELQDIKMKFSKNDSRIVETDSENSIKINQDLNAGVLNCQNQNVQLVLQEQELIFIHFKNMAFIDDDLFKQLDSLTFKQLNYYIILKTSDQQFQQSQYDEGCIKQSLDDNLPASMKDQIHDLIPVQSYSYSQYKKVEPKNMKFAFLVQSSNHDHRVDQVMKIQDLIEMSSPTSISGGQINLENFWKEVLSTNSKQPKYGA